MRHASLTIALIATACNSPPNPMLVGPMGSTTDGSTGATEDCPVGREGCPCTPGGGCDPGLVCPYFMICEAAAGDVSTSSDATGSSSGTSGGESSSTTWASTSSGSSTGWTTSGGPVDESSTGGSSTAPAPACGDGAVDDGEDCDDGNVQPGDGCDAACAWEPWKHEGVAHDVPLADLHGWSQCWSDDYSGTADLLVGSLADSCDKANLLFGCTNDGVTLVLAAHAPREDVLTVVNYGDDERHTANGVAWYWSPADGKVGFGPKGNTTKCNMVGEDEQLCWSTTGGEPDDTFSFGNRCGAKLGFTTEAAPMWQRVVWNRD